MVILPKCQFIRVFYLRGKERKRHPIQWFNPRMSARVRTGPGTQTRSATWIAETQILESLHLSVEVSSAEVTCPWICVKSSEDLPLAVLPELPHLPTLVLEFSVVSIPM